MSITEIETNFQAPTCLFPATTWGKLQSMQLLNVLSPIVPSLIWKSEIQKPFLIPAHSLLYKCFYSFCSLIFLKGPANEDFLSCMLQPCSEVRKKNNLPLSYGTAAWSVAQWSSRTEWVLRVLTAAGSGGIPGSELAEVHSEAETPLTFETLLYMLPWFRAVSAQDSYPAISCLLLC